MKDRDKQLSKILKMQEEVIKGLQRSNLSGMYDDIWGQGLKNSNKLMELDNTDKYKNLDNQEENEPPEGFPKIPTIEQLEKQSKENADALQVKEEVKENIEDLKKELDEYIGLESVKSELKNLINLVKNKQLREDYGLKSSDLSLHMVFSGNPGTGKTMVARLMARIYKSLGLLKKGQLIEVDRSGLVAGYVGQTAIKTKKVIDSALDGILFIDEAYALNSGKENDFGQEAINTLLKAMEDNRDRLVVIVAGYTDLMEKFVNSNPGLRSRFNRYLFFEDYSPEELLEIFLLRCNKSGYTLEEEAKPVLIDLFKKYSIYSEQFGNARGVRNIFERAVVAQANRLAEEDEINKEKLMLLTADDIRNSEEI